MSATDETLFETLVRVENKDIFVDLKKNKGGVYLKVSERNGSGRNTVLIPASGISKLKSVLDEVLKISSKVKSVGSRERKSRAVGDPETVARSLYVSGLSWDTTDAQLAEHFSQGGLVVRAVVLRQRRGGNRSSMGCGVVEFDSVESAAHAMNTLNDSELNGRTIHCREDRAPDDEEEGSIEDNGAAAATGAASAAAASTPAPRAPRPKKVRPADEERVAEPNKVYVAGLTWETTSDELDQLFAEKVGPVVSSEVMSTKKGRSMGTGIVAFADPAHANAAVTAMNGFEFKGRRLSVRQFYK